MFRAGRAVNAVMLATGVVLASAGFVLAEAAASQSRSPDLVSATLVLRGSTDALEHEAAATDGSAPSVLRGSRRRSRSRAPAPMRALRVLSTTPIMAVRGPVSPIPPITGTGPILAIGHTG